MRARDNPFAVDQLHRLAFRPQGVSWPELRTRLEQLYYRGAIVGPEGSGKTTLLLQLQPSFAADGWRVRRVQFRRHERPVVPDGLLDQLTPDDMLLIDGAEQLGWWAWRRFLRRSRGAGALLVTLHAPGRLPTWIDCRTSLELLDELMRELVEPLDEEIRAVNRRLYAEHQGNLRHVFRAWYDLWAHDDPVARRLRRREA